MTISRIFMAFTIIANKSPLLDLSSALSLEKPFQNGILEVCTWVIDMLLPDICYSNFNPWPQGAGTFSSVMPPNGCLGESVSLEKLEELLLCARGQNLGWILPKDHTQRCSSVQSKNKGQSSLCWWKKIPSHLGANSESWMLKFLCGCYSLMVGR